MRWLIICIALSLLFACNNDGAFERQQQINRERAHKIDSLNRLLDDEDNSTSFLDSLKNESAAVVEQNILYSKYIQYRKASPLERPNIPNLNADYVDRQYRFFVNKEYSRYTDSIINLLPDSLVSKKILLIDHLLERALAMWTWRDSSKVLTGGGASEIKYAWGSKEYQPQYNPYISTKETNNPSLCNKSVFGLDCSGFIFQLFKQTNILYPAGNANLQRKVTVLKKYLRPYFGNSIRMDVQDYHNSNASPIESGDIIYFYKKDSSGEDIASHIGIALKVNNSLKFFHCSGGRDRCDYNVSSSGGVRCVDITQYIRGKTYGFVRIIIN